MDRFSKLVIVAAFSCFACVANAGYAQLAPPAGFGGSPGNWTYAAAANDVRYGATVHSPNALRLPVPGTTATMPASYRFAANASRVAAAALYISPHLRAAVGIASWLGVAKIVWDASEQAWKEFSELQDGTGKEYQAINTTQWFSNPNAACVHYINVRTAGPDERNLLGLLPNGNCKIGYTRAPAAGYEEVQINTRDVVVTSNCPDGWTPTPGGCLSPQIQQPDFVEKLNPPDRTNPMPSTVPFELPKPTPLPIQQPIINPEPVENPQPRPLFVPTGDPVPNPQYDPNTAPGPNNQPWIQPGTKVTPSPTPSEPWRVDIQPVNRPVPGPEPMPGPEPYPDPNNPNPDPDKPKTQEQESLCEKHPDIIACQKFDDPKDDDLPKSERDISITPDSGWGAETASCPAPKSITVQGRAIAIPYDLFCTYASGMRPIIIAMAWLSAAFILLGARSES